ncbi:tetratricopeptide repeat protein [Acidisoma sp. C75]
MASIVNPPQLIELIKTVDQAFRRAGWRTERRDGNHDLSVRIEGMEILVKCLDETRAIYENPARIINAIEESNREVRQWNIPFLVVLENNFMAADLESLMARDLLVITLETLPLITSLSAYEGKVPGPLDPLQDFTLRRSMEFCLAVSTRLRDAGDRAGAIAWARDAISHSQGLCNGHYHLFWLYLHYEDYDRAAEIGEEMRSYRGGDPTVLRMLIDLETRRGNEAEAAKLRHQLENRTTRSFSLEDMLAKQQAEREKAGLPSQRPPAPPADTAKRSGGLWQAISRRLGGERR